MPYRFAFLFLLLLTTSCQQEHPQLHTLTITPYAQDGEPLTGCLSIDKYHQQKDFWMPEAVIDCDAEAPVEDPEESSAPSYEIRLPIGRYRITAHDLDNRCKYHQELTITSNSPQWLYVDITPN